MDLVNWYLNQLVSVEDMTRFQNNLDSMFAQLIEDLGLQFAYNGMYANAMNPAGLGVQVHPGRCYFGFDASSGGANHGALSVLTNVALNLTTAGASTAVTNTGNYRWVSVWAVPKPLSDTPVVTPAGATIQFRTYRSVGLVVTMGDEMQNPSRPALGSVTNGVLLLDVKLGYNQTVVNDSDTYTDRVLSGVHGTDRATFPYILNQLDAFAQALTQRLADIQALQTRMAAEEQRQMTPGPTGAAATIEGVNATTGPAGSAAAVENTGNAQHAILHFTIPRGADGAAGPNIIPQAGIPVVDSTGTTYTLKMVGGVMQTGA